jgi:hypothetical protein
MIACHYSMAPCAGGDFANSRDVRSRARRRGVIANRVYQDPAGVLLPTYEKREVHVTFERSLCTLKNMMYNYTYNGIKR